MWCGVGRRGSCTPRGTAHEAREHGAGRVPVRHMSALAACAFGYILPGTGAERDPGVYLNEQKELAALCQKGLHGHLPGGYACLQCKPAPDPSRPGNEATPLACVGYRWLR
jgi:hypothetical protein